MGVCSAFVTLQYMRHPLMGKVTEIREWYNPKTLDCTCNASTVGVLIESPHNPLAHIWVMTKYLHWQYLTVTRILKGRQGTFAPVALSSGNRVIV